MKLERKSVLRFIGACALCSFMAVASSCGGNGGKEDPNPNPNPTPDPTPTTQSEELKIMSFNVRYNSSDDKGDNAWDARKGACVAMLKDIQPDVVATQEMRTVQRQYMKENLSEYAFVEIPNTGTGTGANIVMLYKKDRFTLVKADKFFLSYTPDTPSRCYDVADAQYRASITVHLKETATGKEIAVCGTHFPVGGSTDAEKVKYDEARVHSARLCIERLKNVAGDNMMCFLMGDLNMSWYDANGNARENGMAIKGILETYMKDARQNAKDLTPTGIGSFQSFGSAAGTPNRVIDHIFFRNVAETIDFQTITKPYDNIKYISDHFPIMLRVKF